MGKALEDSKKEITYIVSFAKFDEMWGGNKLLCHKSNSKITLHNRMPKVGLVNHA